VAFAGAISAATRGRYTPQIGGLPIEIDGEPAGAMGASGASGQEDEAVVRAAIEATLR
jgi:glc operon protein GlcG